MKKRNNFSGVGEKFAQRNSKFTSRKTKSKMVNFRYAKGPSKNPEDNFAARKEHDHVSSLEKDVEQNKSPCVTTMISHKIDCGSNEKYVPKVERMESTRDAKKDEVSLNSELSRMQMILLEKKRRMKSQGNGFLRGRDRRMNTMVHAVY